MLIGSLFSDSDTDKQLTHVFIHDELNIFDMLQPAVQEQQLNWKMAEANVSEDKLSKKDRKSTRLNSSHVSISYAVFCLKKKKIFMLRCVLFTSHTAYSKV